MRIDYSQLWDEMVALARVNRSILLAIAGAFLFLPALVAGFFTVPAEPLAQGAGPAEGLRVLTDYVNANALPQFVLLLFSTLGQALLYAVLLDPRRPTVGDAFRTAAPLFVPLLLVNILANLLVGFGVALFIIPGLYLLGRLLLSAPALVAERQANPLAAIGRSFALTGGQGWRIFFFVFLIFATAFVLQLAVGGTLGTVIRLVGGGPDAGGGAGDLLLNAIGAFFTSLYFLLGVLLNVALYRRLAGASGAGVNRAI